ncbi:MAG: prolipoprotein diacylglyceryl transferase [Clostridia bacterium]|nr:prolipoprotein diacylglyceryl transferase [Clostridia bacterium]
MVTVSFPGLGIEEFTLNPVAFTIPIFGGIEVRWYGLIITLGIILAFTYCAYRSKQEGIIFDDLLDMAIFTVIFGIIGARLYYVLTSLDKYDSFYDVIAIWNGGLAIYGGIIAGGLTIFVICKIKKIKFLKVFDAVAPAVMIGQFLGRWGNFFNGEAYGEEVLEDSLFYFIRMGLIPNIESATRMHYFHPTFLYESVWNIIGFIIINTLYKKKKFDGQIFLMYISWYGFGRMLIEGLRTDSLYVGVFRISQVVGFVCFVVGVLLLIINLVKARRATLTAMDYAPTYAKIVTPTSAAAAKVETDSVTAETADNTESEYEEEEAEKEESVKKTEEEETAEEAPQYNDVMDKLNKLFDIDKNEKPSDMDKKE